MKELRKTNRTEYERLRKQQQRAKKPSKLSDDHIKKIRDGVARYHANKNARKDAFSKKDTGTGKRKYKRRRPIASLQMAGMINDLERFIGNLSMMSATDYLEAREELIVGIIKRGGSLNQWLDK